MTPQRWAEVDRLLDEAILRSPEERTAFLDSACGADDELRREVESLLAAHQKAEEKFLNLPALEIAAQGLGKERDRSLIGEMLNHYSVISVLGVGGMGEVYLARDTRLERKVALKLLPPQYTQDAARIKRFEREARAASALNHPNIITIYEVGKIGDRHFIAAEYIDGRTLRELLHAGQMAMKDILEIAIQVASALAAAHEAGIVHRDIKPENLMLRRDGYVKVLDFGLVKLTEQQNSAGTAAAAAAAVTNASEGDIAKTNPGAVMGTIRYMSPEQAMGREVDSRSDVFSLGVVLYELLTGTLPFKGNSTAGILDAIIHHDPVPVIQARKDVHPELGRIVGRMLEKDRNLRYQTANDLCAVLKRLHREVDSSPTHSVNTSHSGQTPIPARGRRVKHVALATVILIALVAIGIAAKRFWFAASPEPSPWVNAYISLITDFPGEERDPSLSPDGKNVFYSRMINGQWDIFWQRIGGSNPRNLTEGSAEDDYSASCSPDGTRVIFRSERKTGGMKTGGLFVMGATGESVRQIAEFGYTPAWSPDSEKIACGTQSVLDPKRRTSDSKLWVINVANSEKRQLTFDGDAAQPRWSPNGHRIAFYGRVSGTNRDVWTIPAEGGEPKRVTNDAPVDWNPVWSSDGQYIYFASDRKGPAGLWRIRVDERSGEVLGEPQSVSGPAVESLQMDLSHDGQRIVYYNRVQHANIQVIGFDPIKKTTVGQPAWVTQGSRPSGSPIVSPDGQFVAIHALGAAPEDIFIVNSDFSDVQTNLTNDAALDRNPRWSPDGKRLAFYSNATTGRTQIWVINPDGSGRQQLTNLPTGATYPFWSPKGDRLGYSSGAAGTFLIEMNQDPKQQTPVQLPLVNEAKDWFTGWTWSPDGKFIAGTVTGASGNEVRTQPGIVFYRLDTQRYERINDIGTRPEWLSDSRHLIIVYQNEIWLLDSQTRKAQRIISQLPTVLSSAGISPDDRRIYYTVTDHQADIYLLSLDK